MGNKLKLEVDWPSMPAWANWVAMDSNGSWHTYLDEPSCNHHHAVWVAKADRTTHIPETYAPTFSGNWKDSRVKRPTK